MTNIVICLISSVWNLLRIFPALEPSSIALLRRNPLIAVQYFLRIMCYYINVNFIRSSIKEVSDYD